MAEAIAARMKSLGIDGPVELATRTGLTYQGLLDLRRGRRKNYQARLTGPVTRALRWTPDSIDRLLRGEQPVEVVTIVRHDDGTASVLQPVTPPASADEVAELRAQMTALESRVAALEQARTLTATNDRFASAASTTDGAGRIRPVRESPRRRPSPEPNE